MTNVCGRTALSSISRQLRVTTQQSVWTLGLAAARRCLLRNAASDRARRLTSHEANSKAVVVVAAVLADRARHAATSKAEAVEETHHREVVATLRLSEVDEEELRLDRGTTHWSGHTPNSCTNTPRYDSIIVLIAVGQPGRRRKEKRLWDCFA